MGYEVDKDLLIAYVDHLLEKPTDTTTERFRTYKEKSLQVHSKLQKPVIAKKIRKEVKAFTEQAGFTKEQIVVAREEHAVEQGEASSVPIVTPTSTPTGKTRATKARLAKKKMEEDKSAESQRGKPSKIQFRRKQKIVDPPVAPIQTRKRKKQQAHKPGNDEEATKSDEDKRELKASVKKPMTTRMRKSPKKTFTLEDSFNRMVRIIENYGIYKGLNTLFIHLSESQKMEIEDHLQPEATEEEIEQLRVNLKASFRSKKRLTRMLIGETVSVQKETKMLIKKALGLILKEEKDEQVEEDSFEKFKSEELPKGVKVMDFELDNKYMQDDPIDTESTIIPDDDTRDNVDNNVDNIDAFDVDVQIFEQHEQQEEQVENKTEEKSSDEPPQAYEESEAILATHEMGTVDAMEELAGQIKTRVEIIDTLLETWDNDLKQLKFHFSDAFSKIAL
ncbi:uncharacterized protein LOC131856871 [Cryptomeria japonica]|uniref:uncharacterized protein LOC131856871 n=1 Tax=Cryptomeria japonica TaxID=3369 RepID=UPI0027DA89B9|nr:uncharacterized protein LOC131856871 [Cryptomeria japonica]